MLNQRCRYVFIAQKPHCSGRRWKDRFLGYQIAGVGKARRDVILREAGIFFNNLASSPAISQMAQDLLHTDPSSPDNGFAHQNGRIDNNAVIELKYHS